MVYFRENGYLNRVQLTYQAGKVVAASGSGDRQYLPEVLTDGASWDSNTEAFRIGDLGFKVSFRHAVAVERETVKVPAGTFDDCIRVDTASTEGPDSGYRPGEELVFYYSDWYAPGVGLVLTRQWDDAAHERERSRIELLSYSITPAAQAASDHATIRLRERVGRCARTSVRGRGTARRSGRIELLLTPAELFLGHRPLRARVVPVVGRSRHLQFELRVLCAQQDGVPPSEVAERHPCGERQTKQHGPATVGPNRLLDLTFRALSLGHDSSCD